MDVRGDISTLKAEVDHLSTALSDVLGALNELVDSKKKETHYSQQQMQQQQQQQNHQYHVSHHHSQVHIPEERSSELHAAFGDAIAVLRRRTPLTPVYYQEVWNYASHPTGLPTAETFSLEETATPTADDLKDGEVLLQTVVMSVDPYMRGRMSAVVEKGYIGTFELNKPIEGFMACKVLSSKFDGLKEGEHCTGLLPYKRTLVADGKVLTKIFPSEDVPVSYFLGPMGLTGLSAYLPIEKIGKPKEGETAYVTGAAGAVGSIACQVFKLKGCTVVASAGSDEKVEELLSMGVDKAFNYKKVADEDLVAKLNELCPKGIDIYFDNVGGVMTEATLEVLNTHSRVIACGAISQYNKPPAERYGIKNLFNVISKCITMQGFIAWQWTDEFPRAAMEILAYVKKGELKVKETRIEGFENMPTAMGHLFTGGNSGKTVVIV